MTKLSSIILFSFIVMAIIESISIILGYKQDYIVLLIAVYNIIPCFKEYLIKKNH